MQKPDKNCQKCPRLCAFRAANAEALPTYHNAPVPSFGGLDAELLIVGLAPGLHGANQSGRPFTGDYAGIVLYGGLLKFGLAHTPQEGPPPPHILKWGEEVDPRLRGPLTLVNTRITNAVRCVPPENKPTPEEIHTCNAFLRAEITAMPRLTTILALGLVSHQAVLRALEIKASAAPFGHGNTHPLHTPHPTLRTLYNSYHSSRYNINTGRLTQAMFDEVLENIRGSMENLQRQHAV